MKVFLDFEASSLAKGSYPIEVGWIFEDGRSEGFLIRPAPEWTDWNEEAEALHGIRRATLTAEGVAHDQVARHLLDTLRDHEVYVSAPSWDGMWLSVLLRAAGLPRHAMRLKDADEAHLEAARETLRPLVPAETLEDFAAPALAHAKGEAAERPVAHRALDDARAERELWLSIPRAAQAVTRAPSGCPAAGPWSERSAGT